MNNSYINYGTKSNQIKRGQIWLASVGYLNPETKALEMKYRPVIVVGKYFDQDVLVIPCTTHPSRNRFDVLLRSWRELGLFRPTFARVAKISPIRKENLLELIADRTDPRDWQRIKKKLSMIF